MYNNVSHVKLGGQPHCCFGFLRDHFDLGLYYEPGDSFEDCAKADARVELIRNPPCVKPAWLQG